MRIEHSTVIDHPLPDVRAWHERPGALTRLTPPGLATIEDPGPGGFAPGTRVRVRLGPPMLPRRPMWELRHAEPCQEDQHTGATDPDRSGFAFTDAQVTGPFHLWRHRHAFTPAGETTRLTDRIDLELPGPTGLGERQVAERIERLLDFRAAQVSQDLDLHTRFADTPRLTVAIAGSSGLIGTQLRALLATGGHRVLRLVRRPPAAGDEIFWDPERGRLDAADLDGVDAVVNLAGSPISTRFTAPALREILTSRTASSTLLSRTLAGMSDGPRVLVQASAIGYYGAQRHGELLEEDDAGGDDALARICRAWEACTREAEDAGIRVVHLRTGIVLSDGGGALLPQLPLFLLGAGGRLATKDAVTSWITLDDLTRAYAHALLADRMTGPINAVGPAPVTSAEFARTLGRVLHRPAMVPVPGFGPALLLGRDGARELVRADQDVSSRALQAYGAEPAHRELEAALRHVLHRPKA